MDQHSTLSEDQLREPPTVHLAIGMIAAEHDLNVADAFDLLDQQALDGDLTLTAAAREVLRREGSGSDAAGSGDDGSPRARWGRSPSGAVRGRWAIRDARELVGRAGAGRR